MSYILGLDIGYNGLKLSMGETRSLPIHHHLPAGSAPISHMPVSLSSSTDKSFERVFLGDAEWVAGISPGALEGWERDLHADYPSSDTYRALYYCALMKTGRDVIDVVVSGLPVSQYHDQRSKQCLKDRLEGEHVIAPGKTVTVKKALILPQPLGAFSDVVFTHSDVEAVSEGRVVVIDPGFYSVDFVTLQDNTIRKASSGTSQKAMSRVLEVAAELICSKHGPGAATREKIEKAIQVSKPYILVYGDRVEIGPYMQAAADSVAPLAIAQVRQQMRDEKDVADIVLMTGGGAQLYMKAAKEAFQRSRVIVPRNPVHAIARGYWYWGTQVV